MEKNIITEAIAAKNFGQAGNLIRVYLRKKIGPMVFLYPEPEHVRSASSTLVGVRYFINHIESLRFNWRSDGSIDTSKNLVSVDYWDGTRMDGRPSFRLEFDHLQSLVKTLPMVVSMFFNQKPQVGHKLWIEEDSLIESVINNISADFRSINEVRSVAGGDAYKTIVNIIHGFSQGYQIKDIYRMGPDQIGPGLDKVVKTIRTQYPDFFQKAGAIVEFTSKANASKIDAKKVAAALGISGAISATVSAGVSETILPSKETATMEENMPALAYEEQLEDLRRAMILLMNNATNSLYLAGRGGIGKTQTVEEEMHKRGLEDGSGYFKITGSASTAGIYRILYEHRKDILLFDDSDGALADVDSRNLFKAASDTKKKRKISWMKAGKNYVDPEDYDEENSDDSLPRYFDFEGKIIFISNLKIDKLDPDGALRTRGYLINVDPTDLEIYNYMDKIVDKIHLEVDFNLTGKQRREVIAILRTRKAKEGSANLRQLVRGLNTMAGILRDGGTDYHNMILRYA